MAPAAGTASDPPPNNKNNNGLIPCPPSTALALAAALLAVGVALARLFPRAALAALTFLGAALLALALELTLNPLERWRHRRVPGFPYKAPFGNLPDLARGGGMPALALRGAALYGPTFKVWRGTTAVVVTVDPDAAKKVGSRVSARGMGPGGRGGGGDPLGLGLRNREATGLLLADGERFTMLKRAWQPAFAPASLRAYAPLLAKAALSASRQLRARAAPGFAGAPVDVHAVLAGMTMEAVGSCAFGVDWGAFSSSSSSHGGDKEEGGGGKEEGGADGDDGNEGEREEREWRRMGRQLVVSAEELFGTTRMSDASRWALAAMAVPRLTAPLRFLARRFPDAPLVRRVKARQELEAAARFLVEHARRQQRQREEEEREREEAAAALGASADSGSEKSGAAKTPPQKPKGVTGIAPGSFLASIMRDGRLTADDVAAQAQTFVLAGYETTLSALSLAVALLARHPEKAHALQRAIDESDAAREARREARRLRRAAEGGTAAANNGSEEDGEQGREGGNDGDEGDGDKNDDADEDENDDASIPYAQAALDEAMRLYPPGTAIVRWPGALHPDAPPLVLPSLPGRPDVSVPRATRSVSAVLFAVHRNPEVWPRAGDFVPERFLPAELGGDPSLRAASPSAFLPFGAGARMCIGYRFALKEARLALVALFRALDFEAAAAPGESGEQEGREGGGRRAAAPPIKTATGITMGPSGGVWCRVSERRRCAAM